jgi:glycerol kinase
LGAAAEANDGALVLGTGGFVVVPTGRTPRHVDGLLTTLLYEDVDGPVFAVEGTVHGLVAGIVEAGRRGGWAELPPERIASRGAAAARAPRVDAALEGTGTPDWRSPAAFEVEPGAFEPEEIVRGTLDDLAARFGQIAELLRAAALCPARFAATGGLAFAPHLTSRIAEAMGTQVTADPRPHRTAVGAAVLARDGR